ncbi:TonB family protein [Porphyrobacter sp. SLTP]|jgi:protein TonB|uniref:energy transducer TonB n=1 Tax=Porphyrobacter sp. SLTP TaxID=2683266 RepID=UPI0014136602|nr:energy transducer TonB [Porphyrobacter sp. SLTP]NBB24231.1 TonB family protein [Porphyrobacter sp. SLTP]
MSYASQQQGLTGPKLVALIIALAIVGSVGLGMVVFLAVDAVKEAIERVTTVEVKEEEPPPEPDEPPPPEPDTPDPVSPPPPNAPESLIEMPRESPITTTQRETPQEVFRRPDVTPEPVRPAEPVARPPSKARGVQPKNQRSWAARIQDNYPRRAAQEEIEGTVGVRVTVTADGKATGCSVTSSSGSDILDAAACKDLERYGRFDPALNDAGDPISASWSTRITYKLN